MNTEEMKKYFAEAALALNREGFHAEMFHGGKLSVWWDDEPLCEISVGGAVHLLCQYAIGTSTFCS